MKSSIWREHATNLSVSMDKQTWVFISGQSQLFYTSIQFYLSQLLFPGIRTLSFIDLFLFVSDDYAFVLFIDKSITIKTSVCAYVSFLSSIFLVTFCINLLAGIRLAAINPIFNTRQSMSWLVQLHTINVTQSGKSYFYQQIINLVKKKNLILRWGHFYMNIWFWVPGYFQRSKAHQYDTDCSSHWKCCNHLAE